MTVLLTGPSNKTFKKWTEALNLDLRDGSTVPKVIDEDRWWDWANQFVGMNNFGGKLPSATKGVYPTVDSWRNWANDVVDSFNSRT